MGTSIMRPLQVWECRIRSQFVGFYVAVTPGQAKMLAWQEYNASDIDYTDLKAKLYRCPHATEILASHFAA